jgi:hypothetical protein
MVQSIFCYYRSKHCDIYFIFHLPIIIIKCNFFKLVTATIIIIILILTIIINMIFMLSLSSSLLL